MILLFDADKSTSVIEDKVGDEVQIRPVRVDFEGIEVNEEGEQTVVHGMDFHIRHYLNLLFTKKIITYQDPVFGYEDQQTVIALNATAKQLGLDTVVIDSISGMGEGIRLSLIGDSRFSNMTKDLWGKYAIRISKITAMVRDLPINVVLTCHIDYGEDDIGMPIHFPAIKGSQKTDMLRWFDVIVYTTVNEEGHVLWQVQKSEARPFIRSRKPIPEWEGKEYVEPDFGPIFKAYDKVKTLVVGDSGTGKTSSLITIPTNAKSKPKPSGTTSSETNNQPAAEG